MLPPSQKTSLNPRLHGVYVMNMTVSITMNDCLQNCVVVHVPPCTQHPWSPPYFVDVTLSLHKGCFCLLL